MRTHSRKQSCKLHTTCPKKIVWRSIRPRLLPTLDLPACECLPPSRRRMQNIAHRLRLYGKSPGKPVEHENSEGALRKYMSGRATQFRTICRGAERNQGEPNRESLHVLRGGGGHSSPWRERFFSAGDKVTHRTSDPFVAIGGSCRATAAISETHFWSCSSIPKPFNTIYEDIHSNQEERMGAGTIRDCWAAQTSSWL